jgi:glycosyltransferase involved in cell wall biosynthesis
MLRDLKGKHMRRIIFDCERMKYPDNGLYHYCLNLSRQLEEHRVKGREELFFYAPPNAMDVLGKDRQYLPQHSLQKFRMPDLSGFQIWHGTYQNSRYVPLLNRRIKVVLTVHDLNFLYEADRPEWKKERNLRHVQKLIDRADALVFVSEFTQEDLRRHCRLGSKPQYLIHNGSNFLESPALHSTSYRPRKPFLFSIGVIRPKKNFHTLVPLVKDMGMELVIAGKNEDPYYHEQIRENASRWGVEDDVHLLGTVTEKEKSWYFNHCRAFALPSLSEGFGLPVVEAMSMGKPLFLSSLTALPEIGGDVGFYFRDFNADHMRRVFAEGMRIFNSNGLRNRIIHRATEFSWSRAAEKYWEVYRSLY